MKRTQIINIICSLLLASLLILSVVLTAIFTGAGVNSRTKLVVASSGMQKEYDGTPLVAHSYEILVGTLKKGHSLYASFLGSQTEIGVSENTFTIQILDASGKNVTEDYEIELIFGKLSVTREPSNGNDNPGNNTNLGTSVGGGSLIDLGGRISALTGEGAGNDICLRVKGSTSETVYLKIKSFGAYTGNSWQEAVAYGTLIDDTLSATYLSSLAINAESATLEIKSSTKQYFLPYYMSALNFDNYQKQTSDVMYYGNTEDVYSVSYGNFNTTNTALTVPYYYQEYERNYRSFVKLQYCEVDDETREYMYKIIKDNKLNGRTRLETVRNVANYIQNSARYSLNYDKNLDQEENIAVAFLDQYREGICQHYASAATLLYRTMGIPARYTIGFTVDTKSEEWVEVRGKSAHAWVEVYIDGMGWVMVEVTNGFSGPSEPQKTNYSAYLTPVLTDKEYDGTPLYAESRVTGFEKYEAMGYTYEAAINGSRTDIGKSTSIIESFTVYDRNGKDVTKEFDLTFTPGIVHVYYSELVFTSENATRVYDGYLLFTNLQSCKMVSGELREGDHFEITWPTSISNVSTVPADFTVVIYHDQNPIAITDIYKITKKCGYLSIIPREITIKAADASKIYDGRPLTKYSYVIKDGYLADKDFIYICQVEGVQNGIGRSENIISEVMIMNMSGSLVTNNYIITLVPGTLEILPQQEPLLPED